MKHPCDCLGRQHSPVIWNGMEHPDCNHLQLLFELQGDCEKCDTNRKQRPSMKTRRRQVGIFHQNYKWLWRSTWKQSKNMEVFGDFTQRQPAPTHLLQWVRKYSFSITVHMTSHKKLLQTLTAVALREIIPRQKNPSQTITRIQCK